MGTYKNSSIHIVTQLKTTFAFGVLNKYTGVYIWSGKSFRTRWYIYPHSMV